jgi:8-oxo-dGTP pyrophosphatase MutT (NUDIX family)
MKLPKKVTKKQTNGAGHLLQQLATHPETLFKSRFRQQVGAICFRTVGNGDAIEILVITTRGSRRWAVPKGWPMRKKKPHEAAATEAWEEAGVRGKVGKTTVGRYTYLKWLDDGDVAPCIVDLFQIEVDTVSDTFKERGERELAWVTPDEAARRVREIELKSILVEFKPQGLRKGKSAPKALSKPR